MKTNHTQGNFSILPTNPVKQWINITSDKGVIARSFYGNEEPIVTKEEAEANAKLMASAPELLKVLQSYVNDFESDYVVSDGRIVDNPQEIFIYNYKLAKEAIKKAII